MNLVQIEKLKYWMVQMALAPPGTSKYATPATLAVAFLLRGRP